MILKYIESIMVRSLNPATRTNVVFFPGQLGHVWSACVSFQIFSRETRYHQISVISQVLPAHQVFVSSLDQRLLQTKNVLKASCNQCVSNMLEGERSWVAGGNSLSSHLFNALRSHVLQSFQHFSTCTLMIIYGCSFNLWFHCHMNPDAPESCLSPLQGENLVIPSTWPMWNLASGGPVAHYVGSCWIMPSLGCDCKILKMDTPKKRATEMEKGWERNWNHLESEVPMICRPVSSFSATTASWTYWQAIWW